MKRLKSNNKITKYNYFFKYIQNLESKLKLFLTCFYINHYLPNRNATNVLKKSDVNNITY